MQTLLKRKFLFKYQLLHAIVFICCVHSSMAAASDSEKSKVISLSGTYGTLAYSGSVERVVKDAKVIFTVKKLTLKYLSIIATNPVDQIHVNLEIVATQHPTSGKGPWKRIFSKYVDTHVTLTAAAPTKVLQNIIFTLPLPLVTQADSVGLGVNDAGMLWPFEELK